MKRTEGKRKVYINCIVLSENGMKEYGIENKWMWIGKETNIQVNFALFSNSYDTYGSDGGIIPRLTHAVHQGGLPDDDFDLTTGSECENDNEGAGGNRMKTIDEVLDEELEQEVLLIHKPELFWIHMLIIPQLMGRAIAFPFCQPTSPSASGIQNQASASTRRMERLTLHISGCCWS